MQIVDVCVYIYIYIFVVRLHDCCQMLIGFCEYVV